MGDLTKVLDGTVDEVKGALAGMSHVDLLALRKEEAARENRKGVLTAVDAALEATPNEATLPVGVSQATSDADNGVAAAETIDTSGAPQQIVPDVDLTHPAVDADPRANTTADQNRIDFNDPTKEGVDVVCDELGMTKPEDVQTPAAE